MDINAFGMDREIPEGVEWEALHGDANGEGNGVADYYDHRELDGEPEAQGREDAEVEEENRKFGDVLDKGVEYLGDVVKLRCQGACYITREICFCTCCRIT